MSLETACFAIVFYLLVFLSFVFCLLFARFFWSFVFFLLLTYWFLSLSPSQPVLQKFHSLGTVSAGGIELQQGVVSHLRLAKWHQVNTSLLSLSKIFLRFF